jgi:hypothetical protein
MHRRTVTLTALAALAVVVGAGAPTAVATVPDETHVTNVRFGAHSTFDRMVVDMSGPLPNVKVSKPWALHTDGEGAPVNLKGKGNILTVLSPADAHGTPPYVGPKRIADLHMKYLHGFQLLGDFEGYVSLGLTTDVSNPKYRVIKLTKPSRVIIDVWK